MALVAVPPPLADNAGIDAEISQVRAPLRQVRKERTLLHLQNELAHEQRLLEEARENLDPLGDLSHNPIFQRITISPDHGSRGIKRSRSETLSDIETIQHVNDTYDAYEDVPNRPVPTDMRYRGTSHREFNDVTFRLLKRFAENPDIFDTQPRMVAEAERHLSLTILKKWELHCDASVIAKTWSDLHFFMRQQITRPRFEPEQADSLYRMASQRQKQSVRDFARYLNTLEVDKSELVNEVQRSERLWDGVLPEVRHESVVFPHEESYAALCLSLENAERRIPGRVHILATRDPVSRSGRPSRSGRSKRRRRR